MIDLFSGGALVATRTHTEYDIHVGGRLVARTRNRAVAARHWWSYVGRLLGSSSATRRHEIDVLDASDVPQWRITLEPGGANRFAAEVTQPDGTRVGRVGADGGMLDPFPTIELSGPTGELVGHGASKGAPQFFDGEGRPIAQLTWQGAERPFDQPRWELAFDGRGVTAELRALVVAAVIAWELPR